MTTAAARRWVELIDSGRCACPGCDGSLASSQYPSWRVCVECRCHWVVSTIHGQRREGLFADPRCPARTPDRGEDGPVDGHAARSGAKPVRADTEPQHARASARPPAIRTREAPLGAHAARLSASSGRAALLTTDPEE